MSFHSIIRSLCRVCCCAAVSIGYMSEAEDVGKISRLCEVASETYVSYLTDLQKGKELYDKLSQMKAITADELYTKLLDGGVTLDDFSAILDEISSRSCSNVITNPRGRVLRVLCGLISVAQKQPLLSAVQELTDGGKELGKLLSCEPIGKMSRTKLSNYNACVLSTYLIVDAITSSDGYFFREFACLDESNISSSPVKGAVAELLSGFGDHLKSCIDREIEANSHL